LIIALISTIKSSTGLGVTALQPAVPAPGFAKSEVNYLFTEVDSIDPNVAAVLHRFNSLVPETFPPLQSRHLLRGHWWLVHYGSELVAFAGMVPLEPFAGVGYLKRAYVLPQHRGHGLQLRLMYTREVKARRLGWRQLVSECGPGNARSAANFLKAGFEPCDPEQPWGMPGSRYFSKML
jgi:GNAT superfamily N-acetyltransferase